jgi:DNA-directed RNA polymerase specialized sigma24 family protein
MATTETIERLRELKQEEWHALSVRLTLYARVCLQRHQSHAEDVAQEAIADAFDPSLPDAWDLSVHPNAFSFLSALVRRIALAHRRGYGEAKRRRISDERMERRGGLVESTEVTLARDERAYLVIQRIRQRIGTSDPNALAVLNLMEANVLTMAEQAEHLGCTLDEARSARRRLTTQIKNAEREVDAVDGGAKNAKEKFDA